MDNYIKARLIELLGKVAQDRPDLGDEIFILTGTILSEGVPSTGIQPNVEEIRIALEGRLIEAIKIHRARTGASLKDSKESLDFWRDRFVSAATSYQARNPPRGEV